jgi:single-strand DNA-binding protein
MSRTLNRVQLIGRLGADPQMRYTQSGTAVTTFSLATNRQWQSKDGDFREETDWHSIVAWDKLGQICSEHLTKGRLVYIEGRLQNRSWEQDGQTRYKTEIVASDMLILDSRGTAGEEAAPQIASAPAVEPERSRKVPSMAGAGASRTAKPSQVSVDESDPDDLPF